jgi:hypothetical protein
VTGAGSSSICRSALGIVLATLFIPIKQETPLSMRFRTSALGLGGLVAGLASAAGAGTARGVAGVPEHRRPVAHAHVRHAFSVERPLLDLRLLRFKTFEAGTPGGTPSVSVARFPAADDAAARLASTLSAGSNHICWRHRRSLRKRRWRIGSCIARLPPSAHRQRTDRLSLLLANASWTALTPPP